MKILGITESYLFLLGGRRRRRVKRKKERKDSMTFVVALRENHKKEKEQGKKKKEEYILFFFFFIIHTAVVVVFLFFLYVHKWVCLPFPVLLHRLFLCLLLLGAATRFFGRSGAGAGVAGIDFFAAVKVRRMEAASSSAYTRPYTSTIIASLLS